MDAAQRSKLVPIVLGAALIVGGIAFGLLGGDDPAEPRDPPASAQGGAAPADVAEPEPEEPAPPEVEAPREAPDLSGPDLGDRVVEGAADAHAVSARDGRVVWMVTDRATVTSARYDGGDVVVIYRSAAPERFGGAFTRDGRGVFFSVAGGDDQEPIFFLPAASLGSPAGDLEPIAQGGSPDCLVATDEGLAWADLGVVRRMAARGEPVELARRPGRIAAMAASEGDLYFLEAPFGGAGAHAVMSAPLTGGAPRVRAHLDAAERDALVAAGATLFFGETRGDAHRVVRLAGAEPEIVAHTGLVTALAIAGERVIWAERHGDEPVTIVRSVPVAGGEVRRHGRHQGPITALAAADGFLFFSGRDGLYRAPLE